MSVKRHKLAAVSAEEALIGALMGPRKDAYAIVEAEVSPHAFWSSHLGAAYQALDVLHSRGLSISVPAVVGASLECSAVQLDPQQLELLLVKHGEWQSDADLLAHCKLIKDMAARRRLQSACESAIASVHLDSMGPLAVVDDLQRKLLEASGHTSYEAEDARDVGFQVLERARHMASIGGFPGTRTGFRELDKAILGFCPGDMVVVAARPGMGKSAVLKDFASAVAKEKNGALIFNLEMANRQTIGRQVSAMSGVPYRNIVTGQMTPEQWRSVAEAVDRINQGNLYMDDAVAGIQEIRQRARRVRAKLERQGKRLAIVGVDYLQLVPGTKESRYESISDVSRGLKLLAKELECTVIALAQLNRELERRDDKRPMLSDLRDSGAIEQDADVVLFVHRQFKFDESAPEDEAELIVGKNRNGSCGTILLRWDPKTTRFSDGPGLTTLEP